MSRTIDQLIADVTPLLPLSRDKDNGMHKTSCNQLAYLLDDDRYNNLAEYMRLAANHFPAMLTALREIAYHDDCNGRLDAEEIAKQALTAAEVCE
jgi:hypothetical protein